MNRRTSRLEIFCAHSLPKSRLQLLLLFLWPVGGSEGRTPTTRLFKENGPFISGKKREPKPKLFGPDIFRWVGGLPREGVGAKKGYPGTFAGISRGRPKSLRKKSFNSCPYHFLHFNGVVGSNTLFSNASALTNSLLFRANSTCKSSRTRRLVEHFWVPILRASCSNKLLSAVCGLPEGAVPYGVGGGARKQKAVFSRT